jgi:uncharacterized protein YkwD
VLVGIAMSLPACSAPPAGPQTNSNTNWLRVCASPADCGDGSQCICGACTTSCIAAADCGERANAACVPPGEASTLTMCQDGAVPVVTSVCLPSCTTSSECGSGQVCVAGACVLAAVPSVPFCAPSEMWAAADLDEELRLYNFINAARQGGDLTCPGNSRVPFRLDYRLECGARVHARDMDVNNYLSVNGPQGLAPAARIAATGYGAITSAAQVESAATADQAFGQLNTVSDEGCIALGGPYRDIGIGKSGNRWSLLFGSE